MAEQVQEDPTGDITEFHDGRALVWNAECLKALPFLADESVDAVVTDPPYGLSKHPDMAEVMRHWLNGDDYTHRGGGFMGKSWDSFVPGPSVWRECFRVLKPGGHLLSFAGSRTQDLMGLAIRLAGFEIRDSIAWLYGSGFPKSLDVSKAIDKAAGAEREVVGPRVYADGTAGHFSDADVYGAVQDGTLKMVTAPATEAAQHWQGWGTALKPAFEPIVVGRKPLTGTVAANVLEHGTGALNIDACRTAHASAADLAVSLSKNPGREDTFSSGVYGGGRPQQSVNTSGRWPTNVVLDESQAAELDKQSGTSKSPAGTITGGRTHGGIMAGSVPGAHRVSETGYGDSGGASRFFPVFKYQAKAPAKERPKDAEGNGHPTVKPLELMRWLVRLVTPPDGLVLDPFAGSGTTAEAALLEGFRTIVLEENADYMPLIHARLNRSHEDKGRRDG